MQTTHGTVNLVGLADPRSRIALQGTGLQTVADRTGRCLFTNLPLAIGSNALTVVATDQSKRTDRVALGSARQTRRFTTTIERGLTEVGDAVLAWNAVALRTLQIALLQQLAVQMDLSKFRSHPRGYLVHTSRSDPP
ncbi:MAG: hypothetical protein MUF72_04325 [Elainella sp. Prado103]|nr:hypothetical protein [Elainella sp. Prado103]